jgi:coproporphyrinogen III oxidase-like Fe-S oxidoreductase
MNAIFNEQVVAELLETAYELDGQGLLLTHSAQDNASIEELYQQGHLRYEGGAYHITRSGRALLRDLKR